MSDYTTDFNELTKAQNRQRRREDFDDLQHAIADRDVGRHRRHLTAASRIDDTKARKKRETADFIQRTLEWLLENDREYARLHQQAMDRLFKAEQLIENAIAKTLSELEQARIDLEVMLNRSARLEDGTRVFRDNDGNVWTEDGRRLDDKSASGIHWTGSEPSWEQFLTHRARIGTLEDAAYRRRRIQTDVLGDARDRLTDNDNPLSKDQIGDLLDKIDQAVEEETKRDLNFSTDLKLETPKFTNTALPNIGKRE